MLWLVPGLAFTKYCCEFGTLFCIYALRLGLVRVRLGLDLGLKLC